MATCQLGDLCNLVEDPSLGGYVKDIVTPVDSCFPSSSTGLLETKTNTNKDYESQLSSSNHHGDNFIDLGEGENLGESTNSSNKAIRHVSLEELGVSVEDLKTRVCHGKRLIRHGRLGK
ncbi:hypothetical protein Bca52824_026707 [Brassica carinata]|uniref:Uncharacterized protein n=1 Tax=Brassica carinata TaxID=52824 RepID=A0A8X7V921_BRACI|nr:hypothetical protein Bca52824_026707 [Brassica carinata]